MAEEHAIKGGDPTESGDDSITVSMSVPLPPMPTPVTERIASAPSRPITFHPDMPPGPPVEGLTGPEIDEPVERGAEVTFAPGQDNVEAAMHEIAEDLDLTVSTRVSDNDGPADKQILIRATEHDRERWKRAAEVDSVSLSALIRETMNAKVAEILDCSHPMEFRVSYPWAEHCKKCGSRLRG